jgi:hypothetical protein
MRQTTVVATRLRGIGAGFFRLLVDREPLMIITVYSSDCCDLVVFAPCSGSVCLLIIAVVLQYSYLLVVGFSHQNENLPFFGPAQIHGSFFLE